MGDSFVTSCCEKSTNHFLFVQRFFTILLKILIYYQYTTGAVEETDAVELFADDPTVYL